MYPGTYAAETPDRIAAVMTGTGETLSYGELERRSVQLAHVLHDAGLRPGDVVALLTENNLRAFEVYWAALRSGLYITAVNNRLKPDEVAYIVSDSGATALIVSAELAATAEAITGLTAGVKLRLAFGGPVTGHRNYEQTIAAASAVPFADQPHGATMLYSSGTTGRPKGVRPSLPGIQVTEPGEALVALAGQFFGVNQDSVYLSPGPIYHAAPLRWCGAVQALGGTVAMMKRFDAEQALQAIGDRRVTHAQFVPTMFVRMLQLPQATRDRYDVSSLRVAIHAAAPCPVEVKQKMIDWWGPVLVEYYAGTEGNGMTAIDSGTWLAKPGSVGRSILGAIRICADDGTELPTGETGVVYFERDEIPFTYHNDLDKTRAAQHRAHPGWTTLGDIGYLDEDGFLFLTDRKAFTIISGGVNIYPQETENVLALHPAVYDVAVIGVPDPEMGESVAAFVQPAPDAVPGPELEQEIIAFVKSKIASYKAPRTVRFVDDLPRSEAGKLMKSELRAGTRPAEARSAAIGNTEGMSSPHYSESVVVASTPEALYSMVSDVTRMGEWSPVCAACWWDDGAGPRVGAWFTGRNELPERTWETRSQVVAADPGREFAFEVNGGRVRWGYTFTAVDSGTQLTESWEFLLAGIAGFHDRYGDDAEAQIANRTELAHRGIPVTLAAIKKAAEAD